MNFYTLPTGGFAANTYIIPSGDEAIVIDPGEDFLRINDLLKNKGLSCKAVLLTHAHFDHACSAAQFQQRGAKIYLHRLDVPLLNGDGNLARLSGIQFQSFLPDVLLEGGEKLVLCDMTFHVIHTPGHTAGGVCYLCSDSLFSGDTLFYLSIGRTDFPSGDYKALQDSLHNRIFTLPQNYKVYPGHDRPTTLFFEKENNPYV